MNKFKEQCDALGLIEKFGACAHPECDIYFGESMGGKRLNITWYFVGEENKIDVPIEWFYTLSKTDLDSIGMICKTSSKYIVDALASIQELKRQIRAHELSIEDETQVFEERLGIILHRGGK